MIATNRLLTTAILGTMAFSYLNARSLYNISQLQAEESQVHWGYEGSENPSHWAKLSPEFTTCETGHSQSPIDIHSFQATTLSQTIDADK